MGFWDFLKGASGAIPVVGTGIQALLGGLAGNNANNAELASQQMYNDWLKARGGIDPNTGQITGGAGQLVDRLTAAGFNPFGAQTSYGSNYGTSSSNQRTSFDNIMRKLVDPSQAGGKKALEEQVFGRLGTASVDPSEQIRAVKQINDTYENAMRGALDTVGMQGGGSTARLGAYKGVTERRASDIANYLGQVVPELTRKREFENEASAQGLLRDWQGQRDRGTSTTTGTTNSFGGSSSTRPPSMTELAGLLLPSQPNAPMQTGQSPWLNAGQDLIGGVLGWGQNQGWWGNQNRPPGMTPPINPSGGFNPGPPIASGTYWG